VAKKGGSAPVPDPVAISQAQSTSNQQTAEQTAALNRVNSSGPNGNVTWHQAPDGTWSQDTTLSPEQQQLYNQSTGLQSAFYGTAADQLARAQQAMSQGVDLSGVPALQNGIANAGQIQTQVNPYGTIQNDIGPTDFTADRQAVTDAVYNQAKSRLDPQFAQQTTQLQNSLANQGIGVNSAAYGNATDGLGRTQNDANTQALYSAIQQGANEQNTLFNQAATQGQFHNAAQAQGYGQNLSSGQFANAAQQQQYGQNANDATFNNNARQQGFQEQSYLQQLPLNQLSQLLGLTSGAQSPNAIQYSPTQVAPTDVTGAYALQQQAQAANAANAQKASSGLMGGLFSLGAAALAGPTGGLSLLANGAAKQQGLY
jgi:hypothetical protein